jgi:hypothetical protein
VGLLGGSCGSVLDLLWAGAWLFGDQCRMHRSLVAPFSTCGSSFLALASPLFSHFGPSFWYALVRLLLIHIPCLVWLMAARRRDVGCAKLVRDLSAYGWTRRGDAADAELLALAHMLWANEVCDVASLGPLVGFDSWPGSEGLSSRAMRFLQHVIDHNEETPTERQRPVQSAKRRTVAQLVRQGSTDALQFVDGPLSKKAGPRKTLAALNLPGLWLFALTCDVFGYLVCCCKACLRPIGVWCSRVRALEPSWARARERCGRYAAVWRVGSALWVCAHVFIWWHACGSVALFVRRRLSKCLRKGWSQIFPANGAHVAFLVDGISREGHVCELLGLRTHGMLSRRVQCASVQRPCGA